MPQGDIDPGMATEESASAWLTGLSGLRVTDGQTVAYIKAQMIIVTEA